MNFRHNDAEIKGISRIGAAIATDNLQKVESEIRSSLERISAEKVYETVLQSYLFCGFPAVIESLRILYEIHGPVTSSHENYDPVEFLRRGEKNCRLIYGKNFEKLMENMEKLSPDLKQWMIVEGYGKVMGRKGLNILEREFINVSVLCTRFYRNQLYSHIKGCLNNGATSTEVERLFRSIEDIAGKRNIAKAIGLLLEISP